MFRSFCHLSILYLFYVLGTHDCDLITQNCVDYSDQAWWDCECKLGYEEQNNKCEEINECAVSSEYLDCVPDLTICIDHIGYYDCRCKNGNFFVDIS